MPSQYWNFRIVSEGTTISFVPFVPDEARQNPIDGIPLAPNELMAQVGDIVTFGNLSGETVQPWPVDSAGELVAAANPESNTPGFLSNPILDGRSSAPQFVVYKPAAAPGAGPKDPLRIRFALRGDKTVTGMIRIF